MHLVSPKPPATELVRFWRRRLSAAKARHNEAASEFQRILEDKRRCAAASAEGLHEILKARFEEAGALSDYLETLRIYSALVTGSTSGRATDSFPQPSALPQQ